MTTKWPGSLPLGLLQTEFFLGKISIGEWAKLFVRDLACT